MLQALLDAKAGPADSEARLELARDAVRAQAEEALLLLIERNFVDGSSKFDGQLAFFETTVLRGTRFTPPAARCSTSVGSTAPSSGIF